VLDEPVTGGETLLVHLGGLGDVCLSESAFYSLLAHFGKTIIGVGYKRFLDLFTQYFIRIRSIEERRWLWLFSDFPCSESWQQAVLIGKDRRGELDRRLHAVSTEPLIFIDLYPEGHPIHVEEHQLCQLQRFGIKPLRKVPEEQRRERVILYPERQYTKRKWPYDHFIALYRMLQERDIDVLLLEAPDAKPFQGGSLRFEHLAETAAFFADGGVFVSNDSGLAHLAGACGLTTITLFCEQNPVVWHPRGQNTSIVCEEQEPSARHIADLIREITALGVL
jgi:ADP-heptose:LPS heptosyltransferase